MSPVERFTRDEASKYVWAGLALVALIGLVYAITTSGRAVSDERAAAQDRAVGYVNQVIAPQLQGDPLLEPIKSPALDEAVHRAILPDSRVSRVRIWSVGERLLFSTDQSDRLRSAAGLLDPLLSEAASEGPITGSDLSDSGGADDPERSLLRTYVPVGTTGVAEIDQTDGGTVGPVRTAWFRYQVLAAGVLLLLLVMIGLSLRDPIEPINAGVPFAHSSIPAGFSLIDDDRLHAVHEVYRLASERVARLKEKLAEAEGARRGLEGYIQQRLSKVGASASHPATAAPPVAAPPVAAPPVAAPPVAVPAAASEPTVVQVPESEVVVTSPQGRAWSTAPAGPLARAARDQKSVPVKSRKKKPAKVKPKRAPKKLNEKPEPERPVAPPLQAAKPRPAPEPERKEAAAVSTPAARPAPAPKPVSAPAPAPVAARAATSSPKSPAPQVDDARAHAAALETFIRLTESDRQPHDTTKVDQGAVRAALARTAARKKPGGERLQLPEESPGGPPAGSDERPTGRSSSSGRP
jgi:hypothetical protein